MRGAVAGAVGSAPAPTAHSAWPIGGTSRPDAAATGAGSRGRRKAHCAAAGSPASLRRRPAWTAAPTAPGSAPASQSWPPAARRRRPARPRRSGLRCGGGVSVQGALACDAPHGAPVRRRCSRGAEILSACPYRDTRCNAVLAVRRACRRAGRAPVRRPTQPRLAHDSPQHRVTLTLTSQQRRVPRRAARLRRGPAHPHRQTRRPRRPGPAALRRPRPPRRPARLGPGRSSAAGGRRSRSVTGSARRAAACETGTGRVAQREPRAQSLAVGLPVITAWRNG